MDAQGFLLQELNEQRPFKQDTTTTRVCLGFLKLVLALGAPGLGFQLKGVGDGEVDVEFRVYRLGCSPLY